MHRSVGMRQRTACWTKRQPRDFIDPSKTENASQLDGLVRGQRPCRGAAVNGKEPSMFRRKVDLQASGMGRAVLAAESLVVDIDLSKPLAETMAPRAISDRGWLESSRDLLRGLYVAETPMDTLPSDLIDEFLTAQHVRGRH